MKKRSTIFAPVLLLLTAAFALMPSRQEFGKITLPLGTVEIQSAGSLEGGGPTGSSQWVKARMRQAVYVNDKIRTQARSRVEITLMGGGKVRIGEKSEIELTDATVKPMQKDFNANLKKGKIWVSAKAAFGEKKNVAVRTPTAVAAIRGTTYRANAGAEESSVLVYEGKVDVNWAEKVEEMRKGEVPKGGAPKFKLGPPKQIEAPEQVAGPYEVTLEEWITLVEGMQINIRKDGKYHMFEFDKAADNELDWVKWNKELDAEKQ